MMAHGKTESRLTCAGQAAHLGADYSANSKKTKIHKKTDGQLLQMNKSFNNLKMKQKDKITAWVYEEYKKYGAGKELHSGIC